MSFNKCTKVDNGTIAIVLQAFRSRTYPAIRTMMNVVAVFVQSTHFSISQNDFLRLNFRNAGHVSSAFYHLSVLVQCEHYQLFSNDKWITLIYVFCHIPTLYRPISMCLSHQCRCSVSWSSFIELVRFTSPPPVFDHFLQSYMTIKIMMKEENFFSLTNPICRIIRLYCSNKNKSFIKCWIYTTYEYLDQSQLFLHVIK